MGGWKGQVRSWGKATGAESGRTSAVSVMSVIEDLADEGCVVPIFIRCRRHLSGDIEFSQIHEGDILAGIDRSGVRIRPTRRTRLPLPTGSPQPRTAQIHHSLDRVIDARRTALYLLIEFTNLVRNLGQLACLAAYFTVPGPPRRAAAHLLTRSPAHPPPSYAAWRPR
ncbi:hypothetical protein GCM10018775_48950 [Streptomyces umbrinus]|nr:hypothetical protein GCM10018775_48950 [Streptomyces umbrinus]